MKIYYLNVCGLKSKLKFQEITDIIVSHDIIIFVETKLDDLDILNVPNGYSYITKNRKKMCKKSGGIVIIYKSKLENCLSFIQSESQFVQWVKISNVAFDLQNDIILGCVYVPPEGSKYSNSESFDEIEKELIALSKDSNMHSAIVGDFNAKTGTLNDFIIPDETLLDLFNLDSDNDVLSYMLDYENLENQDVPLSRVSQCSCQPNNYGFKLLNFCKKLNIYIANSRIGLDKGIGKRTCKNTSVVDYFLMSSKLFSLVKEFEIQDFDPLLSDVYNPIHITLQSSVTPNINNSNTSQHPTKTQWFDNKRNEFVNTVHNSQGLLTTIINDLENIQARDRCTQQEIDDITNKINDVFSKTASQTFTNKPFKSKLKPNSKPWYTKKCYESRKKFHKARKLYNRFKNEINKKQLLDCSKQYKQTTNKAYNDYQLQLENKLRNTSKYNGKDFWKILNRFAKNKKDDQSNISIETLYDYFKNLNTNIDNDNNNIDIDINIDNLSPEIEDILNSPITADEIKSVVQKLKNGKSAGSDNILNEYIKYTLDDMLAIYVLLFNVILDKGIIPESWTEGIMIPIYKNKGSKLDPASYRGITLNSCLSKTFTAVLNNRLNKFADEVELISGAQAGFRSGFSTVDNIFVLHSLIAMYFSFGKKLYCSFVDFKSAFDTVWRLGLWQKLQKSNIQGKIFKVIYNMYQNIKTCIRKGEECSVFFNSEVGVKQGENMSPFLFSLFLNDLETFFLENNISDLEQISKKCQDTIACYLKIFIILYADDTVILSESAESLQEAISAFEEYCNIWKLTVNTNKTKIVVFSKKKNIKLMLFLKYMIRL